MNKRMAPKTDLDQINYFTLQLLLQSVEEMAEPTDPFVAADKYRDIIFGLEEDEMIKRLDGEDEEYEEYESTTPATKFVKAAEVEHTQLMNDAHLPKRVAREPDAIVDMIALIGEHAMARLAPRIKRRGFLPATGANRAHDISWTRFHKSGNQRRREDRARHDKKPWRSELHAAA